MLSDERILLVTGVPSKAFNGDYLYKLFGQYGGIQQIRVGSSNLTKGCAIIVYEQCESAAAAIEGLNEFKIMKDRILRVAVYDESRDKRALERRKRQREVRAEYKKHIDEVATEGPDGTD